MAYLRYKWGVLHSESLHLLPTGSYYDLGCQSEGCSTLDHFHGVVTPLHCFCIRRNASIVAYPYVVKLQSVSESQ